MYKSSEKTSSSTRIIHRTICCGVGFTNLLADLIIESYLGVVKKAQKRKIWFKLAHNGSLHISTVS